MITKIFLSFFLSTSFLGTGILYAQKPQKILGLAKEVKTLSYYQEQSRIWNSIIAENPQKVEAWNNYYRAERAKLQLEKPELWPDDKEVFYQQLSPILKRAKSHIGDSFEYYYLMGLNSTRENSIQYLEKAYKIDSDRSETYGWLLANYLPLLEEDKLAEVSGKILRSNIYSNANLLWNYNALMSIDKNGVILTNGDMDSMPKWVLQYGAGIRPDVAVVNKWFLATETGYRTEMLKRLNIPMPSKKESDFKTKAQYVDYFTSEILKNARQPIYMSSGTDINFFKAHDLEDHMYIVGNALKYSKSNFNNTEMIKNNFENKYKLEYLLQNFQNHPEDEVVKAQMNLTYLPGLVHLKKHYQSENREDKVAQCDALINKIAEDSGRKEEVLRWFDQY